MSAERITSREQSTPEELERFVEIAHAPYLEDSDRTLGRGFRYDAMGVDSMDDSFRYGRRAADENSALGRIYKAVYPEATERERFVIGLCDAAVLVRLHWLRHDSLFTPETQMYDADKGFFEAATFGTSPEEAVRHRYLPVSEKTCEETPLIKERIEHGMPRIMQLFMASRAIDSLVNFGDSETVAAGLYHVPELWNLSPEETRAVTRLVVEYADDARLLSIITADERLVERYANEAGLLDIAEFGGPERLLVTAHSAFKEFIKAHGEKQGAVTWLNLEASLSAELEAVFPHQARKELAYETWLDDPHEPSLAEQLYISLPEAAMLGRLFIEDKIEASDSDTPGEKLGGRYRIARRFAASRCECPSEVLDGATYWDYRNVFDMVEAYAQTDDSALHSFVGHYKTAAEQVDEELAGYLDDYAAVIRSGDLIWPIQGWSGAPEEEEVAKRLGEQIDAARARLRAAEEHIAEKVGALTA